MTGQMTGLRTCFASCRYNPDDYAFHYGGVAGVLTSILGLADHSGKEASCACMGDFHDEYDARTPKPMRSTEDAGEPYQQQDPQHCVASACQRTQEIYRQGIHSMNTNEFAEATVSRRADLLLEIEARESDISIKVRKLIRLQAEAARISGPENSFGSLPRPAQGDRSEAGEHQRVKVRLESTRAELARLSRELKNLRSIASNQSDQNGQFATLATGSGISSSHVPDLEAAARRPDRQSTTPRVISIQAPMGFRHGIA